MIKPKVLISDYFLENAEPSEIEAIVAHEGGREVSDSSFDSKEDRADRKDKWLQV